VKSLHRKWIQIGISFLIHDSTWYYLWVHVSDLKGFSNRETGSVFLLSSWAGGLTTGGFSDERKFNKHLLSNMSNRNITDFLEAA